MTFQTAILGARGIGFFHARIFQQLGCQVSAVLGSSKLSAEKASSDLNKVYGINAKPFFILDDLILETKPDIISICTPPKFHLEQLIAALNCGISVFCEKPIFWHKGISYNEVINGVKRINSFSDSTFHVNTSNASFIEIIKDRIPAKNSIKSFSLEFNTKGEYKYEEIACDLLPHGISILLELFGLQEITHLNHKFLKNSYYCEFKYGRYSIKFKFLVGKKVRKKLLFSINSHQFLRFQENVGLTNYRVGLTDLKYNDLIRVEDPFEIYIKRFLESCTKKNTNIIKKDKMVLNNIMLMAKILLKK